MEWPCSLRWQELARSSAYRVRPPGADPVPNQLYDPGVQALRPMSHAASRRLSTGSLAALAEHSAERERGRRTTWDPRTPSAHGSSPARQLKSCREGGFWSPANPMATPW